MRNLIRAGNTVSSKGVTCQQQTRHDAHLEKFVHAQGGLRFRTVSVLRVRSLPGRKPAVPERHP
ncbi:hypothetical protein FKM52_06245 [Mixta tenebrionis]|uniref:Uncharacterized protein n=1 Tax=Mixta tenebrionis TaxID=2562439 RepID=A0A506VCE0_9GAMM|nr:hypothetical protein FKM52_06245 [Mixta tenebrionis]